MKSPIVTGSLLSAGIIPTTPKEPVDDREREQREEEDGRGRERKRKTFHCKAWFTARTLNAPFVLKSVSSYKIGHLPGGA